MARTAGVPKADKSLKGPEINWTGQPIRDGSGYYGEAGNAPEPVKSGAFPPPPIDDVSRRRFSPAEALKRELAAQSATGTAPSTVTQVVYRDGAEVVEKPKKNPGATLKEFWARLRADPAAMEAFLAKKKAGFERWRAKRKAKT